ncbi:MAG TPA: ABC transporter substrate-binding protein [Propionibacteriaceae bacterium]|nr:ABC transporter substrate-binding protein [Propionibacteriaceae bacterium]
MSVRVHTAVIAALLALAGTAACAPEDAATPATGSSTNASPSADACTKDQLDLVSAGTFTVGTDKPAYEPWFVDDDPNNGKGFESAVAYAVAERLGFAKAEVKWIVVPFTNAYAPGDKKFDIDINQVSISDTRRKAVDFSTGYYDVAQTIVSVKGSKIDGATSVAALKEAKLGAQVGTTSYTAITDQIQPTEKPAVYDTNDLAVQALKNGQVDGIVVDLPTAFYVSAAQLDDGTIVGQLPPGSGTPDQFGLVLAKGSSLTSCVSQAVDALKSDGTLADLEAQWLAGTDGAPVLS